MIRRKAFYPYLYIIIFFFLILSIPQSAVQEIRGLCVAGISPSWQLFNRLKQKVSKTEKKVEIEDRLKLENQILKNELLRLEQWYFDKNRLNDEKQLLLILSEKIEDPFFSRRLEALREIVSRQLQSIPAKVIFRDPAQWGSHLWINVGSVDNQRFGKEVVAKNSPVVVGRNVVGVVEEVKSNRALVRLITDTSLHPSVRAVRGSQQNHMLLAHIEMLLRLIHFREDITDRKDLIEQLSLFKQKLDADGSSLYLAKGELQGMSEPLWRGSGIKLKGLGFNYDFSDEEGPARELRTGSLKMGTDSIPLIHVGDLLVTTGMDGVFPPDLHVGVVTKILPLREGGSAYDLEAMPTVSNIHELTEVFILPPL